MVEMEIIFQVGHFQSRFARFRFARFNFFNGLQFRSEEVTAVMVGDALLALMAKSGRVSAYNGPSSTLTLNNPFREKRGWAIYFYVQFYPTPTSRAKSADIGMSPGRKATLPGSCPQWSIDHRKLLRIGMMTNCTLTEFRRRCLSRQTQPRQV